MKLIKLINECKKSLIECTKQKECEGFCSFYGNEIFFLHDEIYTENNTMNIEFQNFLIELFSNEIYFKKRGIEEFLSFLSIESIKDHFFFLKLKDVLIENYNKYDYKNEGLNFVIMDFIVKQYEPTIAFNAIKKINYYDKREKENLFIFFALDCLLFKLSNMSNKSLLNKVSKYMKDNFNVDY